MNVALKYVTAVVQCRYDWRDHQGMTPFGKKGEGGSLQEWNNGVNMLNKQFGTAENRWYTSLGAELVVNTLSL
jgi:hypothetical protein